MHRHNWRGWMHGWHWECRIVANQHVNHHHLGLSSLTSCNSFVDGTDCKVTAGTKVACRCSVAARREVTSEWRQRDRWLTCGYGWVVTWRTGAPDRHVYIIGTRSSTTCTDWLTGWRSHGSVSLMLNTLVIARCAGTPRLYSLFTCRPSVFNV